MILNKPTFLDLNTELSLGPLIFLGCAKIAACFFAASATRLSLARWASVRSFGPLIIAFSAELISKNVIVHGPLAFGFSFNVASFDFHMEFLKIFSRYESSWNPRALFSSTSFFSLAYCETYEHISLRVAIPSSNLDASVAFSIRYTLFMPESRLGFAASRALAALTSDAGGRPRRFFGSLDESEDLSSSADLDDVDEAFALEGFATFSSVLALVALAFVVVDDAAFFLVVVVFGDEDVEDV